jgi:ATP-dependent exoDNAse (exonuclease V) beta subunit
MNGLVDLVVEMEEGIWIIDHKSDRIDDSLAAFGKYQAQLGAYTDALKKSGENVLGTAIHWIRQGDVVVNPCTSG